MKNLKFLFTKLRSAFFLRKYHAAPSAEIFMDTKKRNIIIAIVVVVVISIGFLWWRQNSQPGRYDDFANCLKDKGEKFYGAFWCSHCQTQKALFGSSAKYLPYIECSAPDGNSQLEVCKDTLIKVYPTWKFHDGSTKEGELSLQEIADKSGCQLP